MSVYHNLSGPSATNLRSMRSSGTLSRAVAPPRLSTHAPDGKFETQARPRAGGEA